MRQIFITALALFFSEVSFGQTIIKSTSVNKTDSISTVSLKEVTVNSLRANSHSAVAYSTVKKENIEQRNLGQDIPYLLALTPSFVATSDGGTGIGYTWFRVRGTDGNRVNVTINGVPFNDAESHASYFVDMPDFASSLSSVQVQRGVGTSTNGAATFGASINMQTEGLRTKPYGEISSTIGSFNTNKNTLKIGTGLMKNGFAFDARLSNVKSDGYLDRASSNLKSYYFAGGYYGEKTTLKFITFGGHEKTYQAWYGVVADSLNTNRTYNELGKYTDENGNTKFYDNQVDDYTQTHYQLHWSQVLNQSLNFNVSAHYTNGLGYYEEYKEARNYKEYGLIPDTLAGVALEETDLVRRKWLDNDFYGMTYALNYESKSLSATLGGAVNRYDGNHFGKVIWVRNAQNLQPNQEYYRSNSLKDEFNIFAKGTAVCWEKLFATVDLQYRHINYSLNGVSDKYNANTGKMDDITNVYKFDFFNPKFGLTYQLNAANSLYASYSVAHREPARSNYVDNTKNVTPKQERLRDLELGYRFQSPRFSASTNLYYMKYKDQLILTGKLSEIGEALTSNISDSYRAGIELVAGVKITDWLNWDGNVTLSQNKILNFTEQGVDVWDADWNWLDSRDNVLGKTDIAYSPNVIANSLFSCKFNGFTLGLHSNYVGKQYIDNTSDPERSIDAYFVNNLNMGYELTLRKAKSIQFNLLVNNLFNTQYITNGWTWYSWYFNDTRKNDLRFFPQAGTNFLASITLKF
ncbi:MAG: TonB-dependent receptor [Paludibacter sp.]